MSRVIVRWSQGEMPVALVREFMQLVRTFDATNPGCRFNIYVSTDSEGTAQEATALLEGLDPPVPVICVIPRKPS